MNPITKKTSLLFWRTTMSMFALLCMGLRPFNDEIARCLAKVYKDPRLEDYLLGVIEEFGNGRWLYTPGVWDRAKGIRKLMFEILEEYLLLSNKNIPLEEITMQIAIESAKQKRSADLTDQKVAAGLKRLCATLLDSVDAGMKKDVAWKCASVHFHGGDCKEIEAVLVDFHEKLFGSPQKVVPQTYPNMVDKKLADGLKKVLGMNDSE